MVLMYMNGSVALSIKLLLVFLFDLYLFSLPYQTFIKSNSRICFKNNFLLIKANCMVDFEYNLENSKIKYFR